MYHSMTTTAMSHIASEIPSHRGNQSKKTKHLLSHMMMSMLMSTTKLMWAICGVLQTQKKAVTCEYVQVTQSHGADGRNTSLRICYIICQISMSTLFVTDAVMFVRRHSRVHPTQTTTRSAVASKQRT